MARALYKRSPLLSGCNPYLSLNIRLGRKCLQGANTLAYYAEASTMEKKSIITIFILE